MNKRRHGFLDWLFFFLFLRAKCQGFLIKGINYVDPYVRCSPPSATSHFQCWQKLNMFSSLVSQWKILYPETTEHDQTGQAYYHSIDQLLIKYPISSVFSTTSILSSSASGAIIPLTTDVWRSMFPNQNPE